MDSKHNTSKIKIDREEVLQALKEIKDPEIPTISIIDLGIVTDVKVFNQTVYVSLTPTFAGCPALKTIEKMVSERIEKMGYEADVRTSFEVQWNTDMITEEGIEALKKHGLSPPPRHKELIQIQILKNAICPVCGSKNTEIKTPFGPTLCRSIYYCNDCLNTFEQFKPVG